MPVRLILKSKDRQTERTIRWRKDAHFRFSINAFSMIFICRSEQKRSLWCHSADEFPGGVNDICLGPNTTKETNVWMDLDECGHSSMGSSKRLMKLRLKQTVCVYAFFPPSISDLRAEYCLPDFCYLKVHAWESLE